MTIIIACRIDPEVDFVRDRMGDRITTVLPLLVIRLVKLQRGFISKPRQWIRRNSYGGLQPPHLGLSQTNSCPKTVHRAPEPWHQTTTYRHS